MSRFTILENIRRFEALLAGPLDPDRRRTIEQLLAAENDALAEEDARPEAPDRTPRRNK